MAVPHHHSKPFRHPPEAILFDIGRVIVALNLARAFGPLAAILGDRQKGGAAGKQGPEQIWKAIQSAPQWHAWQEGHLTAHQWHEHLTNFLSIRLGFADFCTAWNSALDPHTILDDEFFALLGARYRLGLLSNTDPIHVEYLERHFSFVQYFPVRIYSCRAGLSKPDHAIYRKALEELKVVASGVLYIDDVQEYAMAAREVGMDAVHFRDAEQLGVELKLRGISAD